MAETFAEMLSWCETLYADVSTLSADGYLWLSEDTGNRECPAFRARINRLVADVENRALFFTLWWRQVDDAAADPGIRRISQPGSHHHRGRI